jgi:hypothetical protein
MGSIWSILLQTEAMSVGNFIYIGLNNPLPI